MKLHSQRGFEYKTKKEMPMRKMEIKMGTKSYKRCHMDGEGGMERYGRRSFGMTEINGEVWLPIIHMMWKQSIRSLYRASSLLKSVVRELSMLDLVGEQEIKWKKGGNEPADNYSKTSILHFLRGCLK
jgi:hypothetical protein